MFDIDTAQILILMLVGVGVGLFGGLLGLGGSIIMIPVLTIGLGHNQHLSQAAAMIVNVFIALLAIARHHRAKAIRWDVMGRMIPAGSFAMIMGVILSNQFDALTLRRIFGAFILAIFLLALSRIFHADEKETDAIGEPVEVGWGAVVTIASAMGFVGGLLGIGGGPIAVPLLQRLAKLPIRQAIATSSAVMATTSFIGAAQKNAHLNELADAAGEALNFADSFTIALAIAPGAMVGAFAGASLTHILPERLIRIAFLVVLALIGLQMLGVW